MQPRSPHLHRDPLLTINATDYTNSVKHRLSWEFAHSPSSGGVLAVENSVRASGPQGLGRKKFPAFPYSLQADGVAAGVQGR